MGFPYKGLLSAGDACNSQIRANTLSLRCVPKFSNLSGAGARPEAKHVWSIIKANITKSHDAEIDKKPKMAYKELSLFQFLINGSVHGWFLRPKMFPLARQGDTPSANPSRMGWRMATSIAFWSALFQMLPVGWSSTLLGLWLAIYVPGLIGLHNTFQNEPDDYYNTPPVLLSARGQPVNHCKKSSFCASPSVLR